MERLSLASVQREPGPRPCRLGRASTGQHSWGLPATSALWFKKISFSERILEDNWISGYSDQRPMEGFCPFIATVIRARSDSHTLNDEPAKPLLALPLCTYLRPHYAQLCSIRNFHRMIPLPSGWQVKAGNLHHLTWFEEGRGKSIVGCPQKSWKNASSRRLIRSIYSFSHTEFVCL